MRLSSDLHNILKSVKKGCFKAVAITFAIEYHNSQNKSRLFPLLPCHRIRPIETQIFSITLIHFYQSFCVFFMPPTLKKWGGILVSACPYVCMYVCTYVCMYSCSRYRLETSCMDSSWKNSRHIFLVFPELSPLVKLRPFDKQGDEIL